MSRTLYLDPAMVPPQLKRDYSGKKFSAVVCESVELHNTHWEGGTRSTYWFTDLVSGQAERLAGNSAPSMFGTDHNGKTIPVKSGFAIVEHSIFCGKDMGLTFYVHPDNAAALLPEPTLPLTDAEQCLLAATSSLKSSYAGRKPRIDMMHANGFSDSDIESARVSLIAAGMLRKNSSITPKGRNAAPDRHKFKSY